MNTHQKTKNRHFRLNPAGIYLLKVNNRNTRTRCEICSKFTIKTPERRQWRPFGVFIVNFEYVISGWEVPSFNLQIRAISRVKLLVTVFSVKKHKQQK